MVGTKREIFAWAMYDWANSAYSTLYITVLVGYLQHVDLSDEHRTRAYGWVISFTNLLVAILSPVLGAVADLHASKRRWLGCTALVGAGASSLMFFATPDRGWLLVGLFAVAQLSFELSQGFYNGFLPEIADEHTMDRVSAFGYGCGYVGGGLALAIFLVIYKCGPALGLPAAGSDPTALLPRVGLLFMGLWWGMFTIPALLWLRDKGQRRDEGSVLSVASRALRQVGASIRNIRRYRMLALFLLGFLFYNDGVQTVLSQASVFATRAIGMDTGELAMLVLMIQFIALPGAILVGRLATRYGQRATLLGCLAVWIGLLMAAWFVTTRTEFWIMGAVLALVMGGIQSVSRAVMGQMTPAQHTAEFFGFFNLSSKAASMFGPLLFTEVLARTGSPHNALISLLVFFIIGSTLVSRVNILEGRRQAAAQ